MQPGEGAVGLQSEQRAGAAAAAIKGRAVPSGPATSAARGLEPSAEVKSCNWVKVPLVSNRNSVP